MTRLPARVALALIRIYQAGISPGLGARCRFEPTCSRYAHAAIERFGLVRGGWMALRRLGRCRPGGSGGFDPVPGEHSRDARATTTAGSGSTHAG